jgi:hypothetical protein
VIQEVCLAPRVLHFGYKHMFWQCEQLEGDEIDPGGLWSDPAQKYSITKALLNRFAAEINDQTVDVYTLWDFVMDAYSRSKLTYPKKDKIIALTAMSKQTSLNDDLVAGLWRKRLPFQLLWEVVKYDPKSQRPEYQAPSWSWASLNVPIFSQVSEQRLIWSAGQSRARSGPDDIPNNMERAVFVSINDVKVLHKEDNSALPLVGGRVTIHAPMRKMILESTVSRNNRFGPTIEIEGTISGDCGDIEGLKAVYCLWVVGQEERTGYEGRSFRAYGLVLRRSFVLPGEYIREGIFKTGYVQYPTREDVEEWFRHGLDERDDYESVSTDHEDGIPRYVVTII